ncbi:MAG: GNAT family N-acetyltransferase [Actinomycetaceae bacterium]|nr:GNAT family N-acetyltransferase [Actinomycetaceae bacterium]
MTIRKMTIDDYEDVYALWMSCKGMGLNNLDDSREGIDSFLRRNPETCFVAVNDDELVGVIISGHDGRRGYVYHTAVHPDYRRQGIGRDLVAHAMSALKQEGINKVAMLVFAKNETGNAFWETEGFTARTDVVYRNKELSEIVRIDT